MMQTFRPLALRYLLPAVCMLTSTVSASAQLMLEKDIRMAEYPLYYDWVRNSIIESNITDSFIKARRVRTLTELFSYKDNGRDTIIPLQKLYYDPSGQLTQRELFYYGYVYYTEYFTYAPHQVTVHNRRFENDNRLGPGYTLYLDTFGNPVKYISLDSHNHHDGLDSISYQYTYDARGKILTRRQQLFYDGDKRPVLLFRYTYSPAGHNTGYTVSDIREPLYAVTKEVSPEGVVLKRYAVYNYGKGPVATDLRKTASINGPDYFDSTTYIYGTSGKLGFIKRTFRHDPMSGRSENTFLQLLYDQQGFLTEKYSHKDHAYYRWELYE